MKQSGSKRNYVFIVSAVLSLGIALWGILGSSSFASFASGLMASLEANFAWLYLYGVLAFVLFAVVIAASRFGRVRLGADDERPEYGRGSWFAMLFAAGMGVGLVFWGVAEPLSHYVAPMAGVEPLSAESAAFSMRSCFMHWGLHPWALYAVVGMALAYFAFRKGKTILTSNALEPVLGKQAGGWVGKAIDVYAVILTAIGVATSFGMGCLQISGGLEYLFGVPSNAIVWALIIAVVASIYVHSAVSGVGKSIRILSNINLVICAAFMVLAFAVGPQADIVRMMVAGVGDYILNFFQDSVRMSSEGDSSWIMAWRVFYWAWWLSWAPFVGSFIARISRGRTIREFVIGVMVAPTVTSIVWFSVFGGLAIDGASAFTAEQLAAMVASPQTALYSIFSLYPLGTVLCVIAMVLLFAFFITSADSATYVLAMFTSGGQPDPPKGHKLFWGILIAVMAFALILSGGVSGIQTIAVVIAFPFFFVMILLCVSLVKALVEDTRQGGTMTQTETDAKRALAVEDVRELSNEEPRDDR